MSKKVLVVDDEKLIVKGIRFSLEQDGMEVDCAYDGEEALRLAKQREKKDGAVLAFGSLSYLGEVIRLEEKSCGKELEDGR